MNMTRKRFLVGSIAAAAVRPCQMFAANGFGGGTPKLRFSVRAAESFGKASVPIFSNWISLP